MTNEEWIESMVGVTTSVQGIIQPEPTRLEDGRHQFEVKTPEGELVGWHRAFAPPTPAEVEEMLERQRADEAEAAALDEEAAAADDEAALAQIETAVDEAVTRRLVALGILNKDGTAKS